MALSWVEMLILATRNMADFEGCGIRLINPRKKIRNGPSLRAQTGGLLCFRTLPPLSTAGSSDSTLGG